MTEEKKTFTPEVEAIIKRIIVYPDETFGMADDDAIELGKLSIEDRLAVMERVKTEGIVSRGKEWELIEMFPTMPECAKQQLLTIVAKGKAALEREFAQKATEIK